MIGKRLWQVLALIIGCTLTLILTFTATNAQGLTVKGMTIDTVNARTGPGTDYAVIAMIPVRADILVEGRNRIGNWVLVHTVDAAMRGWVASRYTVWEDNIPLDVIPVTEELLGAAQSNPTPPDNSTAPSPPAPPLSSGRINGSTIDTLNVRSGPSAEQATVGKIPPRTRIIIEGRNTLGNWVLIHAADSSIRGWVASRYTTWDEDIALENIPVTEVQVGLPAPDLVVNPNTNTLPTSGAEEDMIAALAAIPVVSPISANVRAIYQRGQEMGNIPQNFTKIGDSNSESQAYLGLLGLGAYNLGSYRYLQATIDYYKGGGLDSFSAETQTARSGMVTTSIIDPLFSDPHYCGAGQSPLDCEFARSRPSIALIYLGAADNNLITHEEYYNALRQIVETSVNRGVIPVLTTMPTKPHYQQTQQRPLEFNMIIVNIARQYDIPLINMWRAVHDLPEHGLQDDLLHFTYSGTDFLDFNGGQNQWGYTAWNLAVLQTLDAIRKAVG